MNDLARTALRRMNNVDQYDLIRVGVNSAFDLGIASGHMTYFDGESVDTWRSRVGS